jgi:hypothetical protein
MNRFVLIVCMVSLCFGAGTHRKATLDVAKVDPATARVSMPHGSPDLSRNVVYEDSCINQYSFWTSMQDPIKGVGDTLILLFRRYGDGTLGSGAIGLVWSVDRGVSWTIDWAINDGLLNDPHPGDYFGRYPTAGYHPDFPAGSWPELLPPGSGWGYATVGNEIDWETAGFYGVFSDNIGVHKNWSWARESDGMIVGMAQDEGDNNHTWIYDPMLGDYDTAPTAQPQLAGFSTYAYDIRDGQWLALGFHNSLGAIAYSASDNGYDNWTTPDTLMPPGAPSGWTVYWIDGCFDLDGSAALAVMGLDVTGGLDQGNEVWFFRPDTAIRLDSGMDTYNHYPQLSLDLLNDEIWVFWCEATHDTLDPEVDGWWHEIYYTISDDGGYTWSTPVNYTETEDVNEVLVQVARYNNVFLYCTTLDNTQGDLYWGALNEAGFDVYETRLFVDTTFAFAVEEDASAGTPSGLGLSVRNVLRERRLEVEFALPHSGEVHLEVYNGAGRSLLRHVGTYGEGTQVETFDTSRFPAGTYFLRLDHGSLDKTAKFVILR